MIFITGYILNNDGTDKLSLYVILWQLCIKSQTVWDTFRIDNQINLNIKCDVFTLTQLKMGLKL